jgi:hypothetical protein
MEEERGIQKNLIMRILIYFVEKVSAEEPVKYYKNKYNNKA